MKVKIKKLHTNATIPTYATDGSACLDVTVAEYLGDNTYSTGLAFEIPENHVMLVFGRSGLAFKHGARLANAVAVVDCDYRGDVRIKLAYDEPQTHVIEVGDRIGQVLILPYPKVEFMEVSSLSDTDRGKGGFGSTGK